MHLIPLSSFWGVLYIAIISLVTTGVALAEEQNSSLPSAAEAHSVPTQVPLKVDTGDTAWVLISTALVMLMTPGLAFFYGGMVGRKNVLGILMQCFTILCIISVLWVLFGYSLSFAPGKGFWGGFELGGVTGCRA